MCVGDYINELWRDLNIDKYVAFHHFETLNDPNKVLLDVLN